MCRLTALVGIKKSKQQQADWKQTDENAVDFIKNKHLVENRIRSVEDDLETIAESFRQQLEGIKERLAKLEQV